LPCFNPLSSLKWPIFSNPLPIILVVAIFLVVLVAAATVLLKPAHWDGSDRKFHATSHQMADW